MLTLALITGGVLLWRFVLATPVSDALLEQQPK